jgi:tetratricopeptide (TPR) repeat protein
MRNPIATCLAVLLPFAVAAPALGQEHPAGEVLLLHLRDGRVQWGTIQSQDPEGFVFSRLDNGGIARLAWGMLDPVQERELQLRFGYVDLTGDEIMLDADRIVTTGGTEFTGKIVDRTGDAILLKTAGATVTIRKDQIGAGSTTVRVPAREVYTKAELYDQQVLADPPTDAAGHYATGEFCERIFDFVRAVEHYRKAMEADPKFRSAEIQLAIARATEKGKNQDQLDYLSDVDSDLRQKRYDKALAKADAFKEKFPSSALIPDAKKKHDQILKARDRDVAERRNFFLRRHLLPESDRQLAGKGLGCFS